MNVVKLISKASECNINQFMCCCFDNDLSVLIVSGKPSPKQLTEAWENILTEFNDTSGQSAPMEELVLMRQILILQARITIFTALIDAYEKAAFVPNLPIPDRGFALFKKYGYTLTFSGDRKDFLNQLNSVKQSELSYTVEHDDLVKELNQLQANSKDVQPTASRKNFLQQIKNIELFYKYQIDFEKYSVERLAILINDFREMVDRNSMN